MSTPPRAGRALVLTALPGVPFVQPGDDLARLLGDAVAVQGLVPEPGDVLVVAQKIVSKAEGRQVDLATVTPSSRALAYARDTGKDPRLVELVLGESRAVLATRMGVMIVEHRLGHVMANAGIDRSNVEGGDDAQVLLLPRDPDASARALRERLAERFGAGPAVIVSDSFGRPWRHGTVGIALGAAGLPALADLRGRPDLYGRPLEITEVGFADEIAAAASLLMGQAAEATPAVWVRGLAWELPERPAAALLRPAAEDLFRRGRGGEGGT